MRIQQVKALLAPNAVDEPLRFCLGGLALVGRRVADPLWRDMKFLARLVIDDRKKVAPDRKLKHANTVSDIALKNTHLGLKRQTSGSNADGSPRTQGGPRFEMMAAR